jgi:GNAT superfamily N-acetyltransferase
VEPRVRRRGIAKALFARLARDTLAEGGGRLAWSVLDWNTPAIATYDAMGADVLKEWITRRLAGDALATLAKEAA